MKLDLGCGSAKQAGFFGIDKRRLPDVDLVCDLEAGIPLPDHSADLVLACRLLPYIRDLPRLMAEIYRVCTHQAIVCVLVPYARNLRHMSNPLLHQKFDEYSPRYWTPHFFQPPDASPCPPLDSYAEAEPPPYDFRLLRQEFFYEPAYRSPLYEKEELMILKDLQLDVVSEIMFHLVVVKKDIGFDELEWLSRRAYFEPPCAAELREPLKAAD
ncbi:class I SAM-dependent methyltransferase [Paenibacillus athensensis]|uniref:Methyltransferase type 11 domain-containing protein n=1 Tax=Paenibacillus athensensis TaxID=1967502 RepID=A0A4Y8Q873_9BACL|nr:methyltransferase domain-containing protein [Paenibacillus athensensis]MCD1257366.1 class I SAM-dependent methyltransferase [Paenibacillus athensensis]